MALSADWMIAIEAGKLGHSAARSPSTRMKPDFEKMRVPMLALTRRSVRSMMLRPRT
jgi:hypothetical protein